MSAAQTYPLPPTSADRSAGQRRSSLNSFAVASYVKSPFFLPATPLASVKRRRLSHECQSHARAERNVCCWDCIWTVLKCMILNCVECMSRHLSFYLKADKGRAHATVVFLSLNPNLEAMMESLLLTVGQARVDSRSCCPLFFPIGPKPSKGC